MVISYVCMHVCTYVFMHEIIHNILFDIINIMLLFHRQQQIELHISPFNESDQAQDLVNRVEELE